MLLISLPMGIVALAHGVVLKYDLVRSLRYPLDMRATFRGKRLFGENKTFRGLLVHLIFSILGTYISGLIQEGCFGETKEIADLRVDFVLIGSILGFGMSLGELPNSFIKRQLNIQPGTRPKGYKGAFFFFLDQVDMVFGIWLFLPFFIRSSLRMFLLHLCLFLCLHPLVAWLGFHLKMRKTKT